MLQLGLAALVDVDPERDEGQALGLGLAEELVDLGPMEQQLPVPLRLVVLPAGALPGGDVGPDQSRLAKLDPGEGVRQVDLPGPDRLDLGSKQRDAGLDRVFDRELMPRPAVQCDRLLGNVPAPRLWSSERYLNARTPAPSGRRSLAADHPQGGPTSGSAPA